MRLLAIVLLFIGKRIEFILILNIHFLGRFVIVGVAVVFSQEEIPCSDIHCVHSDFPVSGEYVDDNPRFETFENKCFFTKAKCYNPNLVFRYKGECKP